MMLEVVFAMLIETLLAATGTLIDPWIGTGDADTVLAGPGNDILYGQDDNDILEGGDGNDKLYGDYDEDTFAGGDGADHMWGGDDGDIFYATKDDTWVHAVDDTFAFVFSGPLGECYPVTVPNPAGGTLGKVVCFGEFYYGKQGTGDKFGLGDPFGSVIGLDLCAFLASMRAAGRRRSGSQFQSDVADEINVGNMRAGADTLRGEAGDDILAGDVGNDAMSGGPGVDHFEGGPDMDKMWGGAGRDIVYTLAPDRLFVLLSEYTEALEIDITTMQMGQIDGRQVIFLDGKHWHASGSAESWTETTEIAWAFPDMQTICDNPPTTPSEPEAPSPTDPPVQDPTPDPTATPTASPTNSPTASPTVSPTASPTGSPTASPTSAPTDTPTDPPTLPPICGNPAPAPAEECAPCESCDAFKTANGDLTTQVTTLEGQVNSLQNQVTTLENTNGDLTTANTNLQNQVDELQEEVDCIPPHTWAVGRQVCDRVPVDCQMVDHGTVRYIQLKLPGGATKVTKASVQECHDYCKTVPKADLFTFKHKGSCHCKASQRFAEFMPKSGRTSGFLMDTFVEQACP